MYICMYVLLLITIKFAIGFEHSVNLLSSWPEGGDGRSGGGDGDSDGGDGGGGGGGGGGDDEDNDD